LPAVVEPVVQLSQSDIIGIGGAVATVVVGIISWVVSAYFAKKQTPNEELSYRMSITPLMNTKLFKDGDKLEIKYKGVEIDQLVYLELDIINTGNIVINKPPMTVESSADATYIIPAYLDDVPAGYSRLWDIEQEDGETCRIVADHINPGQVIKARFLMDAMPKQEPDFACPAPGLRVRRITNIQVSPIGVKLLAAFYPSLANVVRALT